ncbi:hypothetical protein NTE_01168 [Candidatus Nitrososphaera evergladensis SR1]|uniref:Uncharacterized protein n=1 Tax=Candidatus Nitrososphaera evergladensis SR1 TaxID=1459636 RepID=A0A075MNZ1_9ARCH|nr:hypothetical protein [Candidatus Nitrososphaera evergladensis]AIF83241.1 hypothetical protein NTE_01168 [Candidatus Nitrososphaera evergladensis SR1]
MAEKKEAQSYLTNYGYKTINLLASTVDTLKAEFQAFQKEIGEVYGNPLISDYLDLLVKLYINRHNLPRLMLVSKGPGRVVMYDTRAQVPIAISLDKKGNLSCTRVQALDEYVRFAKKYAPELFATYERTKARKTRGQGRSKKA